MVGDDAAVVLGGFITGAFGAASSVLKRRSHRTRRRAATASSITPTRALRRGVRQRPRHELPRRGHLRARRAALNLTARRPRTRQRRPANLERGEGEHRSSLGDVPRRRGVIVIVALVSNRLNGEPSAR
jgi:hypothetical protein